MIQGYSTAAVDRATSLSPHFLLVLTAFSAAVAGQGAYYPPVRVLVTALTVAASVAALRAYPLRWSEAWPVPAACAVLAGWAAIRAAAAGEVTNGLPTAATLGCFALTILVVHRADAGQRDLYATAAIGVGVLVAAGGWIGVVWRLRPLAHAADERLWRASSTLTYANAAAALLVALSVLSAAMLLARPSIVRLIATYLLLVGLGATLSRAGLLALLLGLLVLSVLAGVRTSARQLLPVVLGAAVATAGLLPSAPVTAEPRPVLASLALVTGLLLAVGVTRLPWRPWAVALLTATALGAFALVTWILPGNGLSVLMESRASLASPTRTDSARAALRLVADHPVVGVGPGRARFTWALPDGRIVTGRYAHNEYLQVLVDLGTIGLLLLLGVLVAVALTVHRGRARAPSHLLWAGAVAGLATLLVHSGFDFLWQLPVIPLTGALLAGLAGPAIPPKLNDQAAREDE